MSINPYLKAVGGAVTGALAAAYMALNDNVISPQEWVQIAEAAAFGAGLVYRVPNTPDPVPPVTGGPQEPANAPAGYVVDPDPSAGAADHPATLAQRLGK